MATSPSTLISTSLMLAALTLCAVPASAATNATASQASHPKAVDVLKAKAPATGKKSKKALAAAAAAAATTAATASVVEAEPDVTDNKVTEYSCELGNKVTIYTNADDEGYIALRWKKRLHRLARIGTTTGALRFENRNYGLVWIGIPSKGILLDSKLNRQLANECKNADQTEPMLATGQDDKKI